MNTCLLRGLLGAFVLSWALSGCATYKKCGFSGCPGDAEITAAVKDEIDRHSDVGPVGNFNVKTLDGVVYISGKVVTDFQKQGLEDFVSAVPNVKRVVNSVSTDNTSH